MHFPINHRNPYITFSCDRFPSGILQLVLFDNQMNPLSERLVYNKTGEQVKLVFSPDKSSYQKRENVFSEINVTDREGNPLTGHISIAVTDDKDIEADTLNTIKSSELKNAWSPDFRTTIFWKPDLLVSEDGKASFEFYTSDFPTTYSVVIEGLSNDGKIIRQVEKIEVR